MNLAVIIKALIALIATENAIIVDGIQWFQRRELKQWKIRACAVEKQIEWHINIKRCPIKWIKERRNK